MNPSARGWINKLITLVDPEESVNVSELIFYNKLRDSGFIYGSNINAVDSRLFNADFTSEERCKINLLLALINTHNNNSTTIFF